MLLKKKKLSTSKNDSLQVNVHLHLGELVICITIIGRLDDK